MKTNTHTPGPWHVEHPYGESGVYVGGPNTELVAKLYGGSTPDEANARLIAAAPDLLAELKQLRANISAEGWELEPSAAIARAEGRDAS